MSNSQSSTDLIQVYKNIDKTTDALKASYVNVTISDSEGVKKHTIKLTEEAFSNFVKAGIKRAISEDLIRIVAFNNRTNKSIDEFLDSLL